MKRQLRRPIVLIGMMGAGKSSVGRCLHQQLNLPQLDTDELIVSKFGMSIPEIFLKHGEKPFRDAETQVLRGMAIDQPAIIITGGGIVLREENVDLLKRLGSIVWLDADEGILFERAARKGNRPLLQGENPRIMFSQMLQARQPVYAKIADIRVDTSALTVDEVADAILKLLETNDR